MGCSHAKAEENESEVESLVDIVTLQSKFAETLVVPLSVQIAHLSPATFPLCPQVSPKIVELCTESWKTITNSAATSDYGESGMTRFYMSFYNRLDALDENGKFEAVITQNIGNSSNAVAAKGAILIRIVCFMLSIKQNNRRTQLTLAMLGKAHNSRGIRPWQYSLFLEVLMSTIASCLGDKVTHETMKAWVNLGGFVLQGMLPNAIRGQVVETESAVNTSSEFYGVNMEEELKMLTEYKSFSASRSSKVMKL